MKYNDEINDEISEENSDKEAITTTNDHASQMPTTFAKVGGESVDFGGALSSSPLGTSKDFSKNSLSWFESDNQGESLPPLPTSQTKFNLVNEEAKAVEEAENATEPLKKSESFAGHIIPANESHVGMPATDIFAGIALDLGDIQLLHPTDEIQEAVLSIDLNENETSIDLSTPEPPPLGDFGKEFNLQIDRQESRKEDSLTVSNGNEMTELANLTFAMTPQFSLAEDAAPLRSEDDNPTEIDRLWRESAKVVSRAKRGISTDQALSEDSDIGKAVVPPEIPVAPQKEEKVGSKKGDEGQGLGPISLSLTNTPGTASRLTGETTGQTAGTNSANAFGPSKANSQLIGQEQTSLEGMTSLSQNSRVSSLNSKTGSNQNNGSTFVLEGDLQEDVGDWRALISKNTINKNTPKRLLSQAFASEIEKHVAIQIVSLIAGNLESLSGWHWRVWRKPEEYGYPLAGKDRYPSGFGGTILNGPLHRMVIALAPLLIRLYYDRFNTKYLAARLEVPLAAIEKMRRPLTWEKGLLQAVGFEMYASRMSERRYMAFNLPGLNKEIFYEGSTRTLYLDEAYYQKSPPSHLFHRLLGILWSVRINYFIPLALDPRRHVLPLLSDMNEYFSARGLSKIKSALKVKKPTIKALSEMDTNQLRVLHQKAGMPTEVVVAQLWEVMRAHILRLLIAETLDIVGVFESVLDKDLLKEDALKPNEIFQRSHFSRMLIEFITKLKV